MIALFEQITAMHQQVREFVEQEYPTFTVTAVHGYPETAYVAPLHALGETPLFVLVDVQLRFHVELLRLADGLLLNGEVFVQQDGTFFFDSPVLIR